MTIDVALKTVEQLNQTIVVINQSVTQINQSITVVEKSVNKLSKTLQTLGEIGQTVDEISAPYREFEQSMAELSSITGIAGDDLARLGQVARRTGVDSGLGAQGAAEAFALLASQIDVSKIGLDGLVGLQEKTITLAQAAGMTMDESANAMAGTINQFGLQASEAGRVINVLAAGSKYGAASVPDLAQSFKVVGAAANAAGLSIEDTAGIIEVLSKNNLKGAEAGTAMRNILLQMQTALGVDFSKTSFADALDALKPKMKDAAYMAKTFGMESMAAAQFLIANSDSVREMTDRVTDTNVAAEQAATNADTWNFSLDVQAARMNDWLMSITENNKGLFSLIQTGSKYMRMLSSFAPLFEGVKTGVMGAFDGIKWLTQGVGELGGKSRLAAAGIWVKNTALKVGSFFVGLWGKTMNLLAPAFNLVGKGIGSLWTSIVTKVIPSFMGAMSATWAWTVALLANPITWIVAGIMALIAAIVWCWNSFAEFRAVIYTVWDTIKGFGEAVWNFIVAPFEAAWEFLKGIGNAIGTLFGGGSLEEAGADLAAGFNNGVDKGVGRLQQGVKGIADTASSIGSNYEKNLAAEEAKDAERERQETAKKAGGGLAMPTMPTLPDMGSIGVAMPETAMPSMEQMAMPDTTSMHAVSAPTTVEITYNPTINISGELSAKSREDFLSLLKRNASEIAKMIKEETRKQERANYGIPQIG